MTNSRAVLLLLATAVVASITAAPILGEVAEIGAEDVPAVKELAPETPAEQDSKAPKETVKSILASHGMPTGEKDASKGADAKSDSDAQKTEGAKGGDAKDAKAAAPVKGNAVPKDDTKADSAAAPKDDAKAPEDGAKAPEGDAKADPAAAPKDDAKADTKADSAAAPKDDAKQDSAAAPKDDAKADASAAAPKDDAKQDSAAAPKHDAKADSAAPKDDTKADAKAPKDDAKADSSAAPKHDAKSDAKAPKDDAKADSSAPKDDAKADSAAPKDDAKADAKAPKDDAKADSAAPKDDAKSDAKAPKDDAKADSAASKDDVKAPKDDAKVDSAAPKDDAKAPQDDAKAPQDDAKSPKDDAKADATAPENDAKDAKADSAAPEDDATVAPAANPNTDAKAPQETKEQPHLSMLAADKQELSDAAMDAAGVKPKLKESYDDDEEKAQPIPEPATAKQPVVMPELDKDDEPMAKMPNEAPFRNKENDEDPMEKADPDPFKQMGTFTPEMEKFERHLKWEDENPVKQDGEVRPWDDLNDFQDPKEKVERAKKIADDIFEMTQRQVADKQQRQTARQDVRDIKTKYGNSIAFMKRVRKHLKREDKKEKKESKQFDRRIKKLAKGPPNKKKTAYANMMSTMEKEDEAAGKDPEKPEQWAIDEVTKTGNSAGSIFRRKRPNYRL